MGEDAKTLAAEYETPECASALLDEDAVPSSPLWYRRRGAAAVFVVSVLVCVAVVTAWHADVGSHNLFAKISDASQKYTACGLTKTKGVADSGTATCGSCFPGSALLDVEGAGAVPVAVVRVGDRVRTSREAYEPILDFLHAHGQGEQSTFVAIEHERGVLRASADHVIFTAGGDKLAADVGSGDEVLTAEGARSRVLAVQSEFGSSGMFAPLTASGTVIVDGVAASNYATVGGLRIPHRLLHLGLFPVRAYYRCGLADLLSKDHGQGDLSLYTGYLLDVALNRLKLDVLFKSS